MALTRPQMAAWRVAQKLALRGAAITLRRYAVRNTDTGEPLRNPPEVRGEISAAAALAGAQSLVLSAATLVGYLARDDRIFLAGADTPLTVAAIAESDANSITVSLVEELDADVAAGTGVTLVHAADQAILATVTEGERLVVDGVLTDIRTFVVRLSAFDVDVEPDPQWTVFLPTGSEHPIVSVRPNLVEGVPATYDLQVRQRG